MLLPKTPRLYSGECVSIFEKNKIRIICQIILFFYSDEKGDFIPIADPTVYKENTLLPTAGSVKTNADGKCTGWLVDPLHYADGREKTMVSRYMFVNNLVCHVNQSETLPVEILDVSKL